MKRYARKTTPDGPWKNVARTLTFLRSNAGFTQVQFSKAIGLGKKSAQMVSNAERGLCCWPKKHLGRTVEAMCASGKFDREYVENEILSAYIDDERERVLVAFKNES